MENRDNTQDLHRCQNCNAEITTPYCGFCGQAQADSLVSVGKWIKEVLSELTSADGRLFVSLKYLMFFPGKLDLMWQRGRRRSFMSPVRLYLITAALLFFVSSLTQVIENPVREIAVGWFGYEEARGPSISLDTKLGEANNEDQRIEKVARWTSITTKWLMM